MPDILEPATSPNHRKLAHSVATGGALGLAKIAELQAACRRRAITQNQLAARCAPRSTERSNAEFTAFAWTFTAGLVVGFAAGYASHLTLDALTQRSLPLIGASIQ